MEAKTPKQKKPAGKSAKAGSSPIPKGPCGGFTEESNVCGHMGCSGSKCKVRFVGPTSHIRDHHIVHAARHASHIWSAAIVTGLAVVLTGAIGYAAFGAETPTMFGEFQQLNQRLDKIESMLNGIVNQCQVGPSCGGNTAPTTCNVSNCKAKCAEAISATATTGISLDACNSACDAKCSATDAATTSCVNRCKKVFPNNLTYQDICASYYCSATPPSADQCASDCQAVFADPNMQGICNRYFCQHQKPTGNQCISDCQYIFKQAANAGACIQQLCGVESKQQCSVDCRTATPNDVAAIDACIAAKCADSPDENQISSSAQNNNSGSYTNANAAANTSGMGQAATTTAAETNAAGASGYTTANTAATANNAETQTTAGTSATAVNTSAAGLSDITAGGSTGGTTGSSGTAAGSLSGTTSVCLKSCQTTEDSCLASANKLSGAQAIFKRRSCIANLGICDNVCNGGTAQ